MRRWIKKELKNPSITVHPILSQLTFLDDSYEHGLQQPLPLIHCPCRGRDGLSEDIYMMND